MTSDPDEPAGIPGTDLDDVTTQDEEDAVFGAGEPPDETQRAVGTPSR
jgi:hypothetical protein